MVTDDRVFHISTPSKQGRVDRSLEHNDRLITRVQWDNGAWSWVMGRAEDAARCWAEKLLLDQGREITESQACAPMKRIDVEQLKSGVLVITSESFSYPRAGKFASHMCSYFTSRDVNWLKEWEIALNKGAVCLYLSTCNHDRYPGSRTPDHHLQTQEGIVCVMHHELSDNFKLIKASRRITR